MKKLNGIKVRDFFKKIIQKKHLSYHNTDSFLAFFILFERGRISESAMDK